MHVDPEAGERERDADVVYYPIAPEDLPPPGELRQVLLDGRPVVLGNHEGRYYALDDMCPHQGAPFSGFGMLDDKGWVVCGLHGWRFDVRTGRMEVVGGPAVCSHPVRVREGRVEVGVRPRPGPPTSSPI
jgi:nitrite reductase/ring-hydroxylating ferredoxin subunit